MTKAVTFVCFSGKTSFHVQDLGTELLSQSQGFQQCTSEHAPAICFLLTMSSSMLTISRGRALSLS